MIAKALIACTLLVAAAACSPAHGDAKKGDQAEKRNEAPAARAVRVEIASVHPVIPRIHLVLPGEVEASKDAMLGAVTGGSVERIGARGGARVKAGAPIAWVNKATQDALLNQAKVAFDRAQVDANRAKRAGKSLTGARRSAVMFALRQAQAGLDLAVINAEYAVVRAPFSGIVADVFPEVGEVLPPGGRVARLL